ncbi:AP-1 complex subunit beta-1-like [Lampetra fluviatilis]
MLVRGPKLVLRVAVKNNLDVFYFSALVPIHILFTEDGALEEQAFHSLWNQVPPEAEFHHHFSCALPTEAVCARLACANVHVVASRVNTDGSSTLVSVSMKTSGGLWVLAQLRGGGQLPGQLATGAVASIDSLLSN